MGKTVGVVIGCLCLLVLALHFLRPFHPSGGGGSAPKAPVARPRDAAPVAATRRAGRPEREGPKTVEDAGQGDRTNATDYRLERTGSGVAVAVDEATTPYFLTGWSDPKAERTPRRILRGRVLDPRGAPVGNASVIAGRHLNNIGGAITGEFGTTSLGDGSFELAVSAQEKMAIMALHKRLGSSKAVAIPPNVDLRVELVLVGTGALTGNVKRRRASVQAWLTLSSLPDKELTLTREAGSDGRFSFPFVPAGDYELSAHLWMGITGGTGPPFRKPQSIAPGVTATVDVDLPVGILLVVKFTGCEICDGNEYVEYKMFPSNVEPTGPDELKRMLQSVPRESAVALGYGGDDAANIMQFHDVSPGPYAVCVLVRGGRKPAGQREEMFGCLATTLAAGDDVAEVSVALRRVATPP